MFDQTWTIPDPALVADETYEWTVGEGIVSHAGLALLRRLADATGLTGGLSRALATDRLLVHDRGLVAADPACATGPSAPAPR